MIMKRQEEALAQMELARKLDPLNELIDWLYAVVLLNGSHRYDEAIEWSLDNLQVNPQDPRALAILVEAYYGKGMYKEAYETAKQNWATRGQPEAVNALEQGYAEGGFSGAMSALAEWKTKTFPLRANALFNFIAAARHQEALDLIETRLERRDPNSPYLKEAKESSYWLRLLDLDGSRADAESRRVQLVQESNELVKIFATVIRNTENRES